MTAPTGSRFDDTGRIALHVGQPCTPQIMFDFDGARSTSAVWLAANMSDSKLLTDAAKHHRRVHVTGKWRLGHDRSCSYVSVTNAEPL